MSNGRDVPFLVQRILYTQIGVHMLVRRQSSATWRIARNFLNSPGLSTIQTPGLHRYKRTGSVPSVKSTVLVVIAQCKSHNEFIPPGPDTVIRRPPGIPARFPENIYMPLQSLLPSKNLGISTNPK